MVDHQRLYEVKSATRANFGALWLANFEANKGKIGRHAPVTSLFEKFENIPAIAVGAGPSLDKNIRRLEALNGKAIIISVDTNLNKLERAGISPHFVMSLDPQPDIARFFYGVDTSKKILVAPTIAHPNTIDAWKGEIIFYNKFAPDIPQLTQVAKQNPETGYLIPGGSVLTVGLDLAFRMGANPIGFAGQDLSYPPDGPAYSSDTLYGDQNYEELFSQQLKEMIEDTDIFGRTVPTKKSMFITKQWMEWAFTTWKRKNRADYYNLTEGGIVIKNCEIMTMAEWATRFCCETRNIGWAIKKVLRKKRR
ncbi:Motility accessory factor [hydrothermal vent metagenome]|uniref:Motility accessory factor n=1 Tax=hydrothermal vent metagenome TaxID=652676 RepID=A0A3B1CFG5_9ZZZZ